MTDVEMRFFDEYKKLDAFCKNTFSYEKGVTDYINEMEENFPKGTRSVRSWDRDYRTIKRLRHIRNLIGHQTESSGCTKADFDDLQRMQLRFLRREDPLLLLEKAELEAKKADEAQAAEFTAPRRQAARRNAPKRQSGLHIAAVVLLLAALAIAVAGIAVILFIYA